MIILPNYSAVCCWLHFHPKETMPSHYQLWLDGWRVCLNFAMDFAHNFVVDDPLTFFFSWKVIFCEYIQFWKSLLDPFVLPSLVCLNYLEMISPSSVCLNFSGIVRILFSCELAWLEFVVLVNFVFRLGLKLLCLFLFFLFSCSFSFLADAVPFLFLFFFV